MIIYCVMNIDIVSSRTIINRDILQEQLKRFFAELSKEYDSALVAPVTLTLGDEWQVVLKDIKAVYDLYLKIRRYMSGQQIKCYYGIGIGTMSTLESSDTRAMDGEAFIFARESLNLTKANKKSYKKLLAFKQCKIYLKGPQYNLVPEYPDYEEQQNTASLNEMLNNLIQNNEVIISRMTSKQQQTIELYEQYGTYHAITIAVPELSKSRISERLTSSNYWLLKSNSALFKQLLMIYEMWLREVYYGS